MVNKVTFWHLTIKTVFYINLINYCWWVFQRKWFMFFKLHIYLIITMSIQMRFFFMISIWSSFLSFQHLVSILAWVRLFLKNVLQVFLFLGRSLLFFLDHMWSSFSTFPLFVLFEHCTFNQPIMSLHSF